MDKRLTVRELQAEDIALIANYWLESDPEFLVSMGVDLEKLPTREGLTNMLTRQVNLPLQEKVSYALIWLADGTPVGHTNVNAIEFASSAFMHLHLWKTENRQQGIGTELVKKSLPYFFENLQLQELYCEPYALNPAPNKTLEKAGFEFEKRYTTIPGSLNFEQEVNRWKLTRDNYEKIMAGTKV
ncbi:GNAT family N-acetyltransferase [Pontibacter vulgaris]|uniref:GNAT family N-acetyltransferase n=1 Tax=Pontibacter vulgaris TaxID=2905679 RepID=UPI001FA7D960|nr:GNAT family protein [Pontibacter vulgaris]